MFDEGAVRLRGYVVAVTAKLIQVGTMVAYFTVLKSCRT